MVAGLEERQGEREKEDGFHQQSVRWVCYLHSLFNSVPRMYVPGVVEVCRARFVRGVSSEKREGWSVCGVDCGVPAFVVFCCVVLCGVVEWLGMSSEVIDSLPVIGEVSNALRIWKATHFHTPPHTRTHSHTPLNVAYHFYFYYYDY